jgi:signal transduction histidine kinase
MIFNAHGGRIWVESDVGRGARFTFTLPVAQEKPLNSEKNEASGSR